MRRLLTEKNVQLLRSLAEVRIASTEQIACYFRLGSSRNSTANVLKRLADREFVTRNYLYSLDNSRLITSKPKSVWFLTKQNLKQIQIELKNTQRADLWDAYFLDANLNIQQSAVFQQNTLGHEIGISRFFLSVCKKVDYMVRVPFWLRTSPTHPLVSTHVTATISPKGKKPYTKKLPVNPDGLFCLEKGGEITFYFLEYDNNTETSTDKITNKFIAYYAYFKQGKFEHELLPKVIKAYGIEIPLGAKVGCRVLFVAPNENRRNDLFIKSTMMPTGKLFNFTIIDDVEQAPFGTHWLCKKSFEPFLHEYWDMADPRDGSIKARPSVLRAYREEAINEMTRIAIP